MSTKHFGAPFFLNISLCFLIFCYFDLLFLNILHIFHFSFPFQPKTVHFWTEMDCFWLKSGRMWCNSTLKYKNVAHISHLLPRSDHAEAWSDRGYIHCLEFYQFYPNFYRFLLIFLDFYWFSLIFYWFLLIFYWFPRNLEQSVGTLAFPYSAVCQPAIDSLTWVQARSINLFWS